MYISNRYQVFGQQIYMYYDITARNVIFSFLQGITDNIHLYIYICINVDFIDYCMIIIDFN